MKMLIATLLLATSPAMASAPTSPFSDGTVAVKLTESERANLLQYVNQSKATLETALEEARGKPLSETNRIYAAAIRDVVLQSYDSKPRSELLMRMMLNQALELTIGIPTADGKAIAKPGVLAASANRDVMTVILEDSIRLALSYVEQDLAAIHKQSLLDLPFVEAAARRLNIARSWSASVLEEETTAELLSMVLQHWLNTVARGDQLHQAKLAREIREVDELLKEQSYSVQSTDERVRLLRRKLKWLAERVVTNANDPILGSNDYYNRSSNSEVTTSQDEPEKSTAVQDYFKNHFAAAGTLNFSFMERLSNGSHTSSIEIGVESSLYEADLTTEEKRKGNTASGFPFKMVLRANLPDSTGGSKIEVRHIQAAVIKAIIHATAGLTLHFNMGWYEYRRLNFGDVQAHSAHLLPPTIEYVESVGGKDSQLEIIVRGHMNLGAESFKVGDGEGGYSEVVLGFQSSGAFGVRIAKNLTILGLGEFERSLLGGLKFGREFYGGEIEYRFSKRAAVKVAITREHIRIRPGEEDSFTERNVTGLTGNAMFEWKW